jgi:hypothetical protein
MTTRIIAIIALLLFLLLLLLMVAFFKFRGGGGGGGGGGGDGIEEAYTDSQLDIKIRTLYSHFNEKNRELNELAKKAESDLAIQDDVIRALNQEAETMSGLIFDSQTDNAELQQSLASVKASLQMEMSEKTFARETIDDQNEADQKKFKETAVALLAQMTEDIDDVQAQVVEANKAQALEFTNQLNQRNASSALQINANAGKNKYNLARNDANAALAAKTAKDVQQAIGNTVRAKDHINTHLQAKIKNYTDRHHRIGVGNDGRVVGGAGGTIPDLWLNWGGAGFGDLKF